MALLCHTALVGWFLRRRSAPKRGFNLVVPQEIIQGDRAGIPWSFSARVSRRHALSVPAVLRSRNLIAGTMATLPLQLHGPDRAVRDWPLFDQPDPDIPRTKTFADTYEDLLFEGVAWWRVLERRADGFPSRATYVPYSAVSPSTGAPFQGLANIISLDLPYPENPDGVYMDGVFVPNRDVIRFDSPNPPLLMHAARAIRTCIALDAAAARFADEPMAAGYFQATDGTDPFEDEDDPDAAVQAFLDGWAAARRRHGWAYVPPGITLGSGAGLSPRDMQLADARQHAVLEIARATGIDAEELGVAVTSRTYFNAEDRRLSFITDTLGPYVSAVQDRLSMGDVSPRGSYARISFDGFLRSDITTRLQAYQLGREVGVYDDERIAELEDIPSARPASPPTSSAPAGPMPENVRELPARTEVTG